MAKEKTPTVGAAGEPYTPPGAAGRELGQPGIRLIQRTLPADHQLLAQLGIILVQPLDHFQRDTANLRLLQNNGVMLGSAGRAALPGR